MDYDKYVPMIKALADVNRLKIVDMLSCGQLCACKILERFSFSQPALSQHMKVLCECGLVKGERNGAWIHYSLNKNEFDELKKFITDIYSDNDDCICKEVANI